VLYRRMSGDPIDSPEASEGTASAISDARPR
jgi:hypothetical protein